MNPPQATSSTHLVPSTTYQHIENSNVSYVGGNQTNVYNSVDAATVNPHVAFPSDCSTVFPTL
jgi:hypothetical protein